MAEKKQEKQIFDASYSLNIHDDGGNPYIKGIIIHIEDRLMLRLNGMGELKALIKQLKSIRNEILEDRDPSEYS